MNEKSKAEDIRLVDTKTLQELLSCGRRTAVRIGTAAGAKIQIGKVLRWRVNKINEYLQENS